MKLRLADLTAAEARERLAAKPVVLLPLGSHEDQGPHAPMGDFLCADAMAERIARAAIEAGTPSLVAPTLPFGGADFFGSVPGGIALSPATLRAVLDDMLACLLRHDIARLVILNGHGGNMPAIHEATQAVHRTRGVLVPCFYLWRIAGALLPEILGPEAARARAGHGGDPLSSIAAHLFPALMRPDLAPAPAAPPEVMGLPPSGFGTLRFQGVEIHVPVEIEDFAPLGVFGADPRLASAETGARLVARLTELGASFVAHYARHCP